MENGRYDISDTEVVALMAVTGHGLALPEGWAFHHRGDNPTHTISIPTRKARTSLLIRPLRIHALVVPPSAVSY
ncbi:hypothetical protein AVEN_146390-1 [Araneus ventricosus]|uniref:Uncharacterized protein n=1 Tax=Araneus ventricosus TaxID=182803 RepID=A0A4Y2QY27_ARAVE|nr:hypothetical protein AVEN_146390-1 [Araneus ventricosus]